MFSWILSGILGILVILLCAKIYIMKKSMKEICEGLGECLSTDTNGLILISSGDKQVRRLAGELNRQLELLRKQRRKYLDGDQELKAAVTNISHDLRTPLTAICGYLDLLEREEKSPDAARYLELIGNRAEAMRQLTEELFRYSVILSAEEELKMEPVNVNRVLEESIAGFYGAFTERGIAPVVHMPKQPVVRNLNAGALARIFGNILNNALRYSDGDLEISLKENGEVHFANHASNLDEVRVGKLFHRFFTVEAARNSTGLGLAISKTLLETMGGSISAEYGEGKLKISILL